MADFEVREEEGALTVTLTVIGELDLWTAPILHEALVRCFAGERDIIVDARQVTFIDVSAANLLIGAAVRAGQEVRRFAVLPSRQVRRVLEVIDPDRIVPLGHP